MLEQEAPAVAVLNRFDMIGASDRAIYQCTGCGFDRQYGHREPEDGDYKPLINCRHCNRPTRHHFMGLKREPLRQ